ncbi:hypothetical protein N7512_009879 [Penicillium capsulatum]|nr:hypothetical protein N7512_009879 [Penicillium capsulatum]
MPGVDLTDSVDSSERPLLRSHKALPRRGIVVPTCDLAQPVSPEQNGSLVATPAPPLTPPGANQEDMEPEGSRKFASLPNTPGLGVTPRHPSKPPTPDVTPPRTHSTRRPPLPFILSSSSRAESFQTACESISSDGDMETPVRSSRPSNPRSRVPSLRQNAPNGVRAKLTYVKDQETPPSASQPHSETEYDTGFESFDGEWASFQADGSPTPQLRKRIPSQTRKPAARGPEREMDTDTLDVVHLDDSLMREQNLRGRMRDTKDVKDSPSMERFQEEIGWPSHENPPREEDLDSHRLSAISSTSTVEAMIIDSPKRTQRLLRHTEKRTSLRSASSPITKSEHTSTASNPDSQHRLVHKAARISEQDRRSISSDLSFSAQANASAPHSSVDIIPVVVVPERRSSLQAASSSFVPSKPASRRSSRQRPQTMDCAGDVPRQKKRTMSDSASARSRDPESRGRPFGRPVIPPRSSSLSAPTSRNNSRATSLTSDSLRSHTLAMDQEVQKGRENQPVSPPRQNILAHQSPARLEPPNLPTLVVSSEDVATLRPPSLPYTQLSIPSSSPGPVEIHEATAVSLFAHHNRSLLLIDQRPEARTLQAIQNELIECRVNPRTPDMPTYTALAYVESPLKNPRPPPQPPVSKPLPPLPMQEREAERNQSDGKPLGRRWGSVPIDENGEEPDRGEGDGQQPPSFLAPARVLGRHARVPRKDRSARQSVHNPDDAFVVNNSLGLPQRRIIFDGPPALARRSPELKRLFDNASRGSLVDPNILRTGSPLYQHPYRAISRWGFRVRSISVRSIQNRLRRMRQRRDERKRAARREALKQSIAGPVHVASATNRIVV